MMKKILLVAVLIPPLVALISVLIWPGLLLLPEYLFVWLMNGGHP